MVSETPRIHKDEMPIFPARREAFGRTVAYFGIIFAAATVIGVASFVAVLEASSLQACLAQL